jgi:serine/threonine-protein kinase
MAYPNDDKTLPGGHAMAAAAGPPEATLLRAPNRPLLGEHAAGQAESAADVPGWSQPEVLRAGDYQLGDILGVGGFGTVYRGEHAERRTLAAVKIPHPEFGDNPSVLARFEREIEVIRRLRHPNVVEILDVGRLEDGRPYFAMELLTGTNLQEHVQSRGRLSPDEALAILEPLASALCFAHAHAIVHRDIKPSNVFLCEQTEGVRVVLLDFGIAKLLDATGPALTSSHSVVGTLSCMAPEQILGAPVDERTDVYGLGALLYTMVTGASPFGDAPYQGLRRLLLEGRVPRPSTRARVSPALEEVILRAMSRAKEGRHPSVTALLADVRRAVTGELGSRAEVTDAPRRRALGVYIDVLADPNDLGEGDEELLADFESILPFACARLVEAGFSLAVEAGTSTLLVAPRADDPSRDEELRRRALSAVLSLYGHLLARTGRDPRVSVHLCLHEGELLADERGALVGGDLLELASWIAERPLPGVFASAAVLEGLGVAREPGAPSAGALLCITSADMKAPLVEQC